MFCLTTCCAQPYIPPETTIQDTAPGNDTEKRSSVGNITWGMVVEGEEGQNGTKDSAAGSSSSTAAASKEDNLEEIAESNSKSEEIADGNSKPEELAAVDSAAVTESRESATSTIEDPAPPVKPDEGQAILDKIMALYDDAKFHLAADEMELGPKVVLPKVSKDVETKLLILEQLVGAFASVNQQLPKAVSLRSKSNMSIGGNSEDQDEEIPPGLRRQQSKLDNDLPPNEELKKEGWVDVGCVELGVNAWCRIDFKLKRTFVIADATLNFSILDFLPLLFELQEGPLWVPLCQSSEFIHDFPGKDGVCNARLLHLFFKPPVVTIDMLLAAACEDRLEECGCVVVNIFPLPMNKIMEKDGFKWLGADVPGPLQKWMSLRLPTDCARMCIFPTSRNSFRVLNFQCIVDLLPPIPWVMYFVFRTLSKRMIPQMEETIRKIKGSPIEAAAQKRPQQYEFWNKKILDYWEKRGIQ